MAVLLIKRNLLVQQKENKLVNIIIWLFVVLFSINTIGNLFSKSVLELVLGTLATLVSAVLSFIMVKKQTHE